MPASSNTLSPKQPQPMLSLALQELNADLDTPVTVYLKAAAGQRWSFLLESVEAGEKLGRYSFVGVGEQGIWRYHAGKYSSSGLFGQSSGEISDPLEKLYQNTLQQVEQPADWPQGLPDLPAFLGGAVGYVAYDIIRAYEDLPEVNPDELNVPDVLMIIPESLVIYDHLKHRLLAVAAAPSQAQAQQHVDELCQRLRGPLPPVPGQQATTAPSFSSNFSPASFEAAVETCLEYIRAGDVFQVVPSQRFSAELETPPFALYRALRRVNPSPYLGYLDLNGIILVASSPESLLKSDGRNVITRPIAGTRKRGLSATEDEQLANELATDEKECAEHLMLLDLGRNDIGKISEFGSVQVSNAFRIERYSHVMHMVSTVSGQLKPELTPLHALASVLPMGTVSGAPKIRAMQIIDELEPVRRGPYGGAFGYIAFDGSLDMALTLRTMLITSSAPETQSTQQEPQQQQHRRVHLQAGAGVVADSQPSAEEQETRSKAAALMKAVEMAAGGL